MFAVFRRMFSAKAGSTPTEPVAAATQGSNPGDGAALDSALTTERPRNEVAEVTAVVDLSWWGASHWWVYLMLSLILMVLAALQGWFNPPWAVPHNLPRGCMECDRGWVRFCVGDLRARHDGATAAGGLDATRGLG